MDTKPTLTLDQPTRYRLRLQGRVTADWGDWLTDISGSFDSDQTVVTGVVRDQAALFGWLSFVRNLGVPVISLEANPGTELLAEEDDMKADSISKIMDTAFKGVALAMGVAAVVLNILGTASPGTLTLLLGIGLFCLAITTLK